MRQLICGDFRSVFATKCLCLNVCRSGSREENRLRDVLHVVSHDSCANVWSDFLLFMFSSATLEGVIGLCVLQEVARRLSR